MAIRAYAGHDASADISECTNTRLQTEIMRLMCRKWQTQLHLNNNDFVSREIVQEMESEIPKDPQAFYNWLVLNGCCGGIGFLLLSIHSEDFHAARRVLSTAAKKFNEIIFL
jgi:hypothetical protein